MLLFLLCVCLVPFVVYACVGLIALLFGVLVGVAINLYAIFVLCYHAFTTTLRKVKQ